LIPVDQALSQMAQGCAASEFACNDAQLIYANLTQRFVVRCLYALAPIACDTVHFDENSKGTWEVLETVRKAYLTFKRDQTAQGSTRMTSNVSGTCFH